MAHIEQYSEKAIAVFGDSTKYKSEFLDLGGKFNMNLRGQQGWIFPKSKEQLVRKILERSGAPSRSVASVSQQDDTTDVMDCLFTGYEQPKRLLQRPVKTVVDQPRDKGAEKAMYDELLKMRDKFTKMEKSYNEMFEMYEDLQKRVLYLESFS